MNFSMWLGIFASIAFGLLLGGLVTLLMATQLLGYRIVTVQSFSMKPFLDRGDLLITRPVSPEDLKVGDVILFEEGRDTKLLIAHRISAFINVKTNFHDTSSGEVSSQVSRMIVTKGDAYATADAQPITQDKVRGRLLLHIPRVGLIFDGMPLQEVLAAISVATALAWGIFEVRQWNRRHGVDR
jgi:signal peptidase